LFVFPFWPSFILSSIPSFLAAINNRIEKVQQYKYLGFIINVSNLIEEEIKERTALAKKA
jgi:hypothetical protein